MTITADASLEPRDLSRRRPLQQLFLFTLLGNGLFLASQWLMLLSLPRFVDEKQVGQFALGLAIAGPLFLLLGLQLRHILAGDVQHEHAFRHYLILRLASLPIGLTLAAAIAAAMTDSYRSFLTVMAVATMKAAEAGADLLYGRMMQHEHAGRLSLSLGLKAVGGLTAFLAALVLTRDPLIGALAAAVAYLLLILVADIPLIRSGDQPTASDTKKSTLVALLRLSWPLGLIAGIVSFLGYLPQYVVQARLGEEALGVLAPLYYLALLPGPVVMSFGHAALPRLSAAFASGEPRRFWNVALRSYAIAALMGAFTIGGVALLGPIALQLYGDAFEPHHLLFVIVAGGTAAQFFAASTGQAVGATRRYLPFVGWYLAAAAGSALLSWWLVVSLGLIGGAAAIIVTQGLTFALPLIKVTQLLHANRATSPDHAD